MQAFSQIYDTYRDAHSTATAPVAANCQFAFENPMIDRDPVP